MRYYDVIIIGGGAAGFFAAINIAQMRPELSVAIIEQGKDVLRKVKVSGGGRCNVTHAEFDPRVLVKNYPRGEKELLGPFHQFMTGDVIEWFEDRGVQLKTEDDGRMFPVTNSSQTIIDCFLSEAKKNNIEIVTQCSVKSIKAQNEQWNVSTNTVEINSRILVVATGSSKKFWTILKQIGLKIISPVPSLFTFNINDKRLQDIPGVAINDVNIKVVGTNLESEGPLLVTHVGLSAPSILKLSAFGAIELAKRDYNFQIAINFIKITLLECIEILKNQRQKLAKKTVFNSPQFKLPKRFWYKLLEALDINPETRWADVNNKLIEDISEQLTNSIFNVSGKSTFKEEFVTAGGVDLKEINFKTFESKKHKNLYLAGEVLNIDAVTGGFNFQNAWTGAYIVSKSIAKLNN